jgi:hypothetical protein
MKYDKNKTLKTKYRHFGTPLCELQLAGRKNLSKKAELTEGRQ